ncbi:adenylate/guanylate cyclase domain-containing protein [Fulvitalea axinellae]
MPKTTTDTAGERLEIIDNNSSYSQRYFRFSTVRTVADIVFSVLIWTIVALFYYFLRGELAVPAEVRASFPIPEYGTPLYIKTIFTHAMLMGFLYGSSFELTERATRKLNFFRRKPFSFVLIMKIIMMVFMFLCMLLVTDLLMMVFFPVGELSDIAKLYVTLFFTKSFYTYLIYFFVASCIIFLFRKLHDRLGPWTLWNVLSGRYANPKEERRIFMFLDLKNSTQMAERLGHVKYSRLLQDCFSDITESVFLYEAEVYQYVGDEVVLTWRADKGLKGCRPLALFFDYRKRLEARTDYYMERYGAVPEFKTGLNIGLVTAVEVGVIKRELAYHGEVLNVAARLRSLCSEADRDILISEDLAEYMEIPLDFLFKKKLRGKTGTMAVYAPDIDKCQCETKTSDKKS